MAEFGEGMGDDRTSFELPMLNHMASSIDHTSFVCSQVWDGVSLMSITFFGAQFLHLASKLYTLINLAVCHLDVAGPEQVEKIRVVSACCIYV